MSCKRDVEQVLSAFPADLRPSHIQPLGGAGGFSGARFWRVATAQGPFCLRRWPKEHPDRHRLAYIHRVLHHVAASGFRKLPVPVLCRAGESFVSHRGFLWELSPWLPGKADFHQAPSLGKLQSAMQALAEFHLAAATLPSREPRFGPSPGLQMRREQIGRLLAGQCRRIATSVQEGDWPELAERARQLLQLFEERARAIQSSLKAASSIPVPLQPCIRDIWHDHVLFVGQSVTGFIDFGALRTESVAGDIARLLGSLVGDDPDRWRVGLDSYHAKRPLRPEERQLIPLFDRSGVLLSGMNWLCWIYLDRRRFDQRRPIVARLDETIARLERLAP